MLKTESMFARTNVGVLLTLIFSCSCERRYDEALFRLSSECAALGEKIRIREDATLLKSRYDPRANRCYLEVTELAAGGFLFHGSGMGRREKS